MYTDEKMGMLCKRCTTLSRYMNFFGYVWGHVTTVFTTACCLVNLLVVGLRLRLPVHLVSSWL